MDGRRSWKVFEALSVLPENILNQYVKNIYRMRKSIKEGNSATTNFDEVVLYDAAFEEKQDLARILARLPTKISQTT